MATPTVARRRAGRSNQTAAVAIEAPKIAHIYCRISRDRDNDELGVQRQRAVLRLFVNRVTLNPIGPQSGSKFRPERLDVQLKA